MSAAIACEQLYDVCVVRVGRPCLPQSGRPAGHVYTVPCCHRDVVLLLMPRSALLAIDTSQLSTPIHEQESIIAQWNSRHESSIKMQGIPLLDDGGRKVKKTYNHVNIDNQ
ncbi:hypothetical protein J6590_012910 [Homalodisca vitripennis]|nr:hypothetical protein J6590_012910 [Homalodisca vitripennis]